MIVVDIQGGRQELRTRDRLLEGESATEVLLLDDGGELQVRRSHRDGQDRDRAKREEPWRSWVRLVERGTDTTHGSKQPKLFA
jgi:hypothetical protein